MVGLTLLRILHAPFPLVLQSLATKVPVCTVRSARHDVMIYQYCTETKGPCPAEAHPRQQLLDCSKPRGARILAPSAASPSTTPIPVAPTLYWIHAAVRTRKSNQHYELGGSSSLKTEDIGERFWGIETAVAAMAAVALAQGVGGAVVVFVGYHIPHTFVG